jgi:hypothetical protein
MNDLRATESEPKRRRMSVADELLLALLPTGIVLAMIALIESLGCCNEPCCGSSPVVQC